VPIEFHLKHSSNLAIFTVTGEVGFEEIMEILDAYFRAGFVCSEIVDVSRGAVTKSTFTQMDQIIQWAETNRFARPPDSKTAFVVPRDATSETAGFFQVLSQFNRTNMPVKMFHSLEEAYEWLDLPQEESGE